MPPSGINSLFSDSFKKLNLIKERIQPMSVLCPNIKTGLSWLNLEDDEKVYAKTKLIKGHTIIAPVNKNGNIVTVATIALGRTCLNIIFELDRPNALAALTYSKFRARRNSALTTPTRAVQLNLSLIHI